MSLVNKPIDVLCSVTKDGVMSLVKFKVTDEEGQQQKIDKIKVLFIDKDRETLRYRCVILFNHMQRECVVIYNKTSMVWTLYSIK